MLDGKRKSMQPMAERPGVDHHQLQQFVSSSTWDYVEVRRRVARWAAAHIPRDVDGGLPECRLLAEWPPTATAAEPTDYRLSTLPADIPLRCASATAGCRPAQESRPA
jgi:DDE superfamily endonuclease